MLLLPFRLVGWVLLFVGGGVLGLWIGYLLWMDVFERGLVRMVLEAVTAKGGAVPWPDWGDIVDSGVFFKSVVSFAVGGVFVWLFGRR